MVSFRITYTVYRDCAAISVERVFKKYFTVHRLFHYAVQLKMKFITIIFIIDFPSAHLLHCSKLPSTLVCAVNSTFVHFYGPFDFTDALYPTTGLVYCRKVLIFCTTS